MAIDLDSLWNFGNPELSEQNFIAALDGASTDEAFVLRTQIARTHGLRRNFDKAREVLAGLHDSLANVGPEARTRYYLELGRSYSSAAHSPDQESDDTRQRAREAYLGAINTARDAGLDGLRVDALHMMEFVETSLDAKLRWIHEALDLATSSTQPTAIRWQAALRNNAGYALHRMGRYQEALEEFEQALVLRQAQGNPEVIRIARWMVAWTLRFLGRHTEALDMQHRLEKEYAEASRPNTYVFEELAELYRALGDSAKSEHYARMKQQLESVS